MHVSNGAHRYLPLLLLCALNFGWAKGTYALPNSNLPQGSYPNSSISREVTPQPKASAVLLKELHTGNDLLELRADERLAPASLTKILSALIILDSGKLDKHVIISREAAKAPRTKLRLQRGDVFVLRDLLKAMLITSANDACRAAVSFVGGSEQQFVRLMNDYVTRLQLNDTMFSNACGFDHSNHYSTARDLATLTELALINPEFTEIINTPKTTIRSLRKKRHYVLTNTNRLLGSFPGVEGVKTGYTAKAGRCLIVKARENEKEVLLVLLNAKRRWGTATTLLRYGLNLLGHASPTVQHPQPIRTLISN